MLSNGLLLAVSLGLSGGLSPEDISAKSIDVPLTFERFKTIDSTLLTQLNASEATCKACSKRELESYKLPGTVIEPKLFEVKRGKLSFRVVLGKSSANVKNWDLLWVDANNDKILTDDELTDPISFTDQNIPMRPELVAGYQGFAPKPKLFDQISVGFVSISDTNIFAVPIGAMVGRLPFGKRLKVGVIDANVNGIWGDQLVPKSEQTFDFFALDRNGNDQLEPSINQLTFAPSGSEILAFTPVWQLGDDAFYTIKIKPDGKSLTIEPYSGAMSTIEFKGCLPQGIMYLLNNRRVMAYATGRILRVPSSSNGLVVAMYEIVDVKGKCWVILTTEMSTTRLKADAKSTFRCGAPFKLEMNEIHDKLGFYFLATLVNAGDHEIGSIIDQQQRAPSPPQLEIRNPKGRVVASIPITIHDGSYFLAWAPPHSFKYGNYTAVAKGNFGSFNLKSTPVKIKINRKYQPLK